MCTYKCVFLSSGIQLVHLDSFCLHTLYIRYLRKVELLIHTLFGSAVRGCYITPLPSRYVSHIGCYKELSSYKYTDYQVSGLLLSDSRVNVIPSAPRSIPVYNYNFFDLGWPTTRFVLLVSVRVRIR